MVPAQVRILVARFSYGGNGGISSVHKKMVSWWGPQFHELRTDPRIAAFADVDISDTPIYMTRNKAIQMAQEDGYDFLWMIDSDNDIDRYVGTDIPAKPFFKSSFDFAYERLLRGIPTIVGAPYCGPPPDDLEGGEEVPYIFHWRNFESDNPQAWHALKMYDRLHAAQMSGIAPCAAIGTGCILIATKACDLVKPPYFDYEHDAAKTKKASTEDVYFTRNVHLAGHIAIQQEVLFVNWDAWAGHVKEKDVGRPNILSGKGIAEQYKHALEIGSDPKKRIQFLNIGNDYKFPTPAPVPVAPAESAPEAPNDRVRDIFGHHCESLCFRTPMEDLRAMKELVEMIHSLDHGKRLKIIEVGSWVGESAVAMHSGLIGGNGIIYCVDTFLGSPTDFSGKFVADNGGQMKVLNLFRKNTKDIPTIRAFVKDSREAADAFGEGEGADLVNIDAAHSYEECWADIDAWLRHVADNGYMMFHDYDDNRHPGVKKAVDEIFGAEHVHRIHDTHVAYVSIKEWKESIPEADRNGHVASMPVTA